ncbi:MAG: Smr/MutS family protein, partial [Prevotella sp.]|nr:Smr/MutS family protein [Prevotella sp.]
SKIAVGNAVRIKGLQSIGKVESISGKTAVVIFGDMRTKMAVERLELAESVKKSKMEQQKENLSAYSISRQTRETIDAHRKNFRQEIDVRGMRGDEALNAVMHFIDDAILTDMSQVRILHGKGDGILRQLIRQYLSTVPNVKHFADEHVQFGGAGITVAEIG